MKKFLIVILVIIFIHIPIIYSGTTVTADNVLNFNIFDIENMFVPEFVASNRQIRDITYKTVGEDDLKLDIYYPIAEKKVSYPVGVYIHGGGFIRGDKSQIRELGPLLNFFLDKGWAVVSINYRLIDRDTMPPDNIEDVKDAIYWLLENNSKYHLNSDRLGLVGHSSGGCLALLVGLTAEGKFSSFQSSSLRQLSSQLDFIISMAGPTNLYKPDIFPLRKKIVSLISKKEMNKNLLKHASPVFYLERENKKIENKDVPPILLIHGKQDGFVPYEQSQKFYQKAIESGINCKLVILESCGHTILLSYLPRMEMIKKEIDDFLQNIN